MGQSFSNRDLKRKGLKEEGSETGCTREALLDVSPELLAAAAGPMVAVEGSLHQGGHDTAHRRLVPTSVPLPIVLHAQPATKNPPQSHCKSSWKETAMEEVPNLTHPQKSLVRRQ